MNVISFITIMSNVNWRERGRTQKARPTIRDVAEKANVSIQTVSRVVNAHPDVAETTRTRVQKAIATLRYHPNGIARSLITQSTNTLGIVASGFNHFGPAQMLTGIEREATELGWQLLVQIVHPANASDYDRVASNLISQGVDGVIWAYPELTGERERAFHQQIAPHAQIIFLSMGTQDGSAVISVDNRAGARMAVEHLVARGFRSVGLITGPSALWSSQQRAQGWHDALTAAKLPHGAKQIVEGNWGAASGETSMQHLLKQFPKLDAVFCSNDQMALGALQALHTAGLQVPQNVGVVGFDNSPESKFFNPPLTTIHHDLIELGRLAVRELDRVVRLGSVKPASLLLQPTLVVRGSA